MDHLLKAAIDLMGAHTKDAAHLMPGKREYLYHGKIFDTLLSIDIAPDHALWEVSCYKRTRQICTVSNHVNNRPVAIAVRMFDDYYILKLHDIISEMGQCRPVGVR